MNKSLLTCLLLLLSIAVQAQSEDRWVAFRDSTSTLIGFKDANGKVKIAPRFSEGTRANYFEHIIAVVEEKEGRDENYYLTKTGKKAGRDSLHIFDFEADCESEGFIRFRDKASGQVGMFDKNGKVVIPALYNHLSKVHNGLVWALKGATERYLDKHKEHSVWEGGEELLLNLKHEIVLRNFKYGRNVNLYSFEASAKPAKDPNRQSFKSEKGEFYSFIDFDREFKNWLNSNLLNSFTFDNMAKASHDSITFWLESNGWITEAKASFLIRNLDLIREKMLVVKKNKADYNVFIDELNPYMFNGRSFEKYYNNCGEAIIEKYPVMHLVINTKAGSDVVQNRFEFLRTENGYKLISLVIRNGEIK
ncbi:WG repeat-containing protein [Pontibacter sp. BAB1700]|uniref:WG repeat-containing protein n=1 Tax=Pontibacter sp. BAB1700 TaxID=1144253 RepID=UPI00031AD263|nr:WG repeat-containing protein [Pontibacter sp. BAB1700]